MSGFYVLLLVSAVVSFVAGGAPTQCNISPMYWCDSPEIEQVCGTTSLCQNKQCNYEPSYWCYTAQYMQECGTTDLCAKYNQTVYGKKVKVTLLYESLCPYCQEFTVKTLTPLWAELGSSIMDLVFIPYGNAEERQGSGTWQYTCQHGPNECVLNLYYSCAIYYLGNNTNTSNNFLMCMEKQTNLENPQITQDLNYCFQQEAIPTTVQQQIMTCQKGSQGNSLEHQNALATQNIWPTQHQYVPWIMINDLSTTQVQDAQNDLLKYVCYFYDGPLTPKACQ